MEGHWPKKSLLFRHDSPLSDTAAGVPALTEVTGSRAQAAGSKLKTYVPAPQVGAQCQISGGREGRAYRVRVGTVLLTAVVAAVAPDAGDGGEDGGQKRWEDHEVPLKHWFPQNPRLCLLGPPLLKRPYCPLLTRGQPRRKPLSPSLCLPRALRKRPARPGSREAFLLLVLRHRRHRRGFLQSLVILHPVPIETLVTLSMRNGPM